MYLSFPHYLDEGHADEYDVSVSRSVERYRSQRVETPLFEEYVDLIRYFEKLEAA
jgi:hypothetical protein